MSSDPAAPFGRAGRGRVVNIGVAIPVPSPWREVLDDARIASGDPLGGIVPAHLTLLGPTEIPAEALEGYQAHLTAVAASFPQFDLHLRGTGSFRPVTEVVFVAVVDGIAVCEQLESAIRRGPARRERNFPYHPHVTVAQNVGTVALDAAFHALAGFEAKFRVESFTLYTHPSPGDWTSDTLTGAPVPWTPRAVFRLGSR
ncbi:2'-5' RNA ligase family protein [Glycomyces sp. TRM65418]|uniref:2'-5' RNA ligase family protein n=1 Tax=Glycomyces sp. TRM65418 TaxID=2867006 RepID=UPI001CE5486D|nr:2'-5' RNA ligase family protein [Glycomyces sp. TRM65418]MCC3763591.1 2'-5' RNA ligase family protein [Glycomyces sp. TRM65418]QZD57573.1 2'-5' RNA ligase family protein [Glycomyces sp. TRM65418]